MWSLVKRLAEGDVTNWIMYVQGLIIGRVAKMVDKEEICYFGTSFIELGYDCVECNISRSDQ